MSRRSTAVLALCLPFAGCGYDQPTTGPGGDWAILDREGSHVTTVTVPANFEPLDIDGDHLLGVRWDPFDVESVRVYRIERRGS